jgi:integrase
MVPMPTKRNTTMLSEAINEYLELQLRELSPDTSRATYHADSTILGMFLRIVGDKQVGSVNAEHLWSFFYGKGGVCDVHHTNSSRSPSQRMPPVSDQTHNSYRSRLRQFVAWGNGKGYFPLGLLHDAFDRRWGRVKPRKIKKVQHQQPAPVTLLAMLDKATNPRDRCYLATAMNTGLRSSELRAITVGQVDLVAGYLVGVVIQKTKDNDDMPISEDLDQELRRWLVAYEADLGRPLENDEYLFPTRTGGMFKTWSYDEQGDRVAQRDEYRWVPERPIKNTQSVVQGALKALGMPTFKEGTHTVRRAVALAYFHQAAQEQGDVAALRETMLFLHHTSVQTTERYLGITAEKNRRNERLKGKPFLTAMIDQTNVVPLRPTATGE